MLTVQQMVRQYLSTETVWRVELEHAYAIWDRVNYVEAADFYDAVMMFRDAPEHHIRVVSARRATVADADEAIEIMGRS